MSKQDYLTPEQIIESYKKYGNDFIVIDIEGARPNNVKKPLVWYININFKSPKSKDLVRPVIKILNLTAARSIQVPADRQYEQVKMAVRRDDENNPNSKFGEAMEIVCNVYKEKIKKLVKDKVISDDTDDLNSKIFPSVKPQTPMQTTAKDKEGNTVKLDNPMFYFNLNYKRYDLDELKNLPKMKDMQYEPAYIKNFDINIFDIEKPLPKNKFELATVCQDEEGVLVNNSNVHQFLKSHSILSGSIMLQGISSKNSFNLNTRFFKSLYVKKSNYDSNVNDGFDDDDMSEMMEFANNLKITGKAEEKEEKAEAVEEEIDDEE